MFGRGKSLQELIGEIREESRSRHLETKSYLGEMREESRRRKEEFERLMEASERRTDETREFNKEILLRNEKVYKGVIVRLEELGEETRANVAQLKSNTAETRTQTQALLRVIDRMDEAGGAAAA